MDNNSKTTSSIRIDKVLWQKARMKALSRMMTISDVIEGLLRGWTEEKGKPNKGVLLDTTKPDEKKRPTRRSLDSPDEERAPTREKGRRFRVLGKD